MSAAYRSHLVALVVILTLAVWLSLGAATRAQAPIPIISDLEELSRGGFSREWLRQPRLMTYTVQAGDTVSGIAGRFGLDIDTIRWSNPKLEENPDYLRPGMEVLILPVRGVYHPVGSGDTLGALALRYGVTITDIAAYPLNELRAGEPLQPGQALIIPYGSKTQRRPRPSLAPEAPFAWPIVGTITQGYSPAHPALDIGAPYGSAVYAARAGLVTRAKWAETGYGYLVWVEHGDGYATAYSHLKGAWVSAGQRVARGQLIGEVGSTGNSSGPHVHFEIRLNWERINPQTLLPATP